MRLIPVQYHHRRYPDHIKPEIDEVAGHFDVSKISVHRKFSLHTEFSYGKRNFNTDILQHLFVLKGSHNEGIPKLWNSEKWAEEFAEFIVLLCSGKTPSIVEIHPPFNDYMDKIEDFLNIYKIFEFILLEHYPGTKILIENRTGSMYRGGKFLVSRGENLRNLSDQIERHQLKLRIALDIPQLLTSYGGIQNLDPEALGKILERQLTLQPAVDSIHLWGKTKSTSGRTASHCGDLNSYFENHRKKEIFLEWLAEFLSDERPRYFVPEVNSSDKDLHSIVSDLESMQIKFF